MKLSICVPFYNEESIIRDTIRQLSGYMASHFAETEYELILVDDGSTDSSYEIVKSLESPQIRLISYQPNHGKGYAVRQGMLSANGEICMFIDADLAYGTDVISQFYRQMEQSPEVDVLIGSRAIHPNGYKQYTVLRKIASKTYIHILQLIGGFPYSDSQCGCKAFRKKARQDIFEKCECNGYEFDYEALLFAKKLGYSVSETAVQIINHRESKVSVFRDAPKMIMGYIKITKRVNAK